MDHATLARTTSHTASPKTTLPTALLEHSGKQVFVLLFHIVKIIIFNSFLWKRKVDLGYFNEVEKLFFVKSFSYYSIYPKTI